jgi:hypothetical protein
LHYPADIAIWISNPEVACLRQSIYEKEARVSNRIEKRIELDAPPSRVWRALTDHREFGE